jgi:hypothetical protein
VGPIPLAEVTRDDLEALARAAVAASFDAVWLAENRARGVGGGLAAAAMVAQWVPIRVGVVIDFGDYHPLYAAEDIAVADLASGGRIEVVLRGGAADRVGLLVAALSGAHLHFDGDGTRVPARLDANENVPDRLALNPRPAQPVVPLWALDAGEASTRELGVGSAVTWKQGGSVPATSGRWPGLLLCPEGAAPGDLLEAARDAAAYFVVAARTPADVAETGRRLAGPLRMPAFPGWINQQ